MLWVAFGLAVVALVKYYTANEMRKLDRRLGEARAGLHKYKRQLEEVQVGNKDVEDDEAVHVERIRLMKEIIADSNIRLATGREAAERSRADRVAERFERGGLADHDSSM